MVRASISLTIALCFVGILCAQDRKVLYRSGNIDVTKRTDYSAERSFPVHIIMRDGIHFGMCIDHPQYKRMPTTYYHPKGPLGVVMKKFDWFPGEANTYTSDSRLPASLVGSGAGSAFTSVGVLWSEPPVAVIGMHAGNTAAYARPLQHMHFYEPNKKVVDLHQRKGNRIFFHHIPDARKRGARIRITHGNPRQQLEKKAPRNFYHLMVMEACNGENEEKIFLDLFTREGIAAAFDTLTEDGVLCVHTSHRFVDLPPALAAIATELNLHARRGYDQAPGHDYRRNTSIDEFGHFTSEWVMLSRNKQVLDDICKAPKKYMELLKQKRGFGLLEEYWSTPEPSKHLWTDKGPNLLTSSMLRGHPASMKFERFTRHFANSLKSSMTMLGMDSYIAENLSNGFRIYRLPMEGWVTYQQIRRDPDVRSLWSKK